MNVDGPSRTLRCSGMKQGSGKYSPCTGSQGRLYPFTQLNNGKGYNSRTIEEEIQSDKFIAHMDCVNVIP